jgi:hypothetical protein
MNPTLEYTAITRLVFHFIFLLHTGNFDADNNTCGNKLDEDGKGF